MDVDNIRKYTVMGRHFRYFPDYDLPPESAHFYNMQRFPVLIEVFDNPLQSPILFVPQALWARQGNPVHINKPADPYLSSKGYKMLCALPTEWNSNAYSGAALLNMLDEFFRGYPFT